MTVDNRIVCGSCRRKLADLGRMMERYEWLPRGEREKLHAFPSGRRWRKAICGMVQR